MTPTPIRLTIYDPETNEVKAEHTTMIVPWKLLKKAISLAKTLNTNPDEMSDSDIDSLAGLVVEVFGGKFTVDELDNGADVSEMMAVIQQILAKASGARNPTLPAG